MDAPEGVNPIGCKCILKKKIDIGGKVNTYNGWLVATMISFKFSLAIIAYHDYEFWKMDVKTPLLNGNLLVNVYMT